MLFNPTNLRGRRGVAGVHHASRPCGSAPVWRGVCHFSVAVQPWPVM